MPATKYYTFEKVNNWMAERDRLSLIHPIDVLFYKTPNGFVKRPNFDALRNCYSYWVKLKAGEIEQTVTVGQHTLLENNKLIYIIPSVHSIPQFHLLSSIDGATGFLFNHIDSLVERVSLSSLIASFVHKKECLLPLYNYISNHLSHIRTRDDFHALSNLQSQMKMQTIEYSDDLQIRFFEQCIKVTDDYKAFPMDLLVECATQYNNKELKQTMFALIKRNISHVKTYSDFNALIQLQETMKASEISFKGDLPELFLMFALEHKNTQEGIPLSTLIEFSQPHNEYLNFIYDYIQQNITCIKTADNFNALPT